MPKITVLDNTNRHHVFEGENMQFYTNTGGCEIVDFSDDTDRNKTVAFFSQYQWVKKEETEPENKELSAADLAAKYIRVHEPDKFEQADIDKRDNKPLDHGDLAPETPSDVPEAPPEEKPVPACETCNGAGTVQDEESDDPLDTVMCPDC